MVYWIMAKKYLSREEKIDFSLRVSQYIKEGNYRLFPERYPGTSIFAATMESLLEEFKKWGTLLLQLNSENIIAQNTEDEWIIITPLLKEDDPDNPIYFRVKEEEGRLHIFKIKELKKVEEFRVNYCEASFPESFSKKKIAELKKDIWYKEAKDWGERYTKHAGVHYPPILIRDVHIKSGKGKKHGIITFALALFRSSEAYALFIESKPDDLKMISLESPKYTSLKTPEDSKCHGRTIDAYLIDVCVWPQHKRFELP